MRKDNDKNKSFEMRLFKKIKPQAKVALSDANVAKTATTLAKQKTQWQEETGASINRDKLTFNTSFDGGEHEESYKLGLRHFSDAKSKTGYPDLREAIKYMTKAAESGLAKAQNALGEIYHYDGKALHEESQKRYQAHNKLRNELFKKDLDNREVRRRLKRNWINQSLDNTFSPIKVKKIDVRVKDAEAVKWYRKAAKQGNACAQCNLGFMYQKGYGVSKDYKEAHRLFSEAADQGNACAQFNLGDMYQSGIGVVRDPDTALVWFKKAREQGNEKPTNCLSDTPKKQGDSRCVVM